MAALWLQCNRYLSRVPDKPVGPNCTVLSLENSVSKNVPPHIIQPMSWSTCQKHYMKDLFKRHKVSSICLSDTPSLLIVAICLAVFYSVYCKFTKQIVVVRL